ncbi:MAG: hypothetical protein R3D00_10975 [Bacteroidia bacterium]
MTFIRTIPIVQITPLIHFQWTQENPCLRATELKPKIQTFITEDLKRVDNSLYNNKEYVEAIKKFLPDKDGQPRPSPYRLDVIPNSDPKWYLPVAGKYDAADGNTISKFFGTGPITGIPNSAYFANAEPLKRDGNKDALRLAVFYDEPLTIRLSSFDPKVLDLVEKAIPYVLAYHNFGTRQSKGFGSFLPEGMSSSELEKHLAENPSFIKIGKQNISDAKPEKILEKINTEYKALKNKVGFANGKSTNSSKLKDYFASKNIEWEKNFVSKELAQEKGGAPGPRVHYVRALFGLAELYDYPKLSYPINKAKITIESVPKDKIERFASPLLLKPAKDQLFLIARPIPKVMLGASFLFTGKRKSQNLQTPAHFNWDEFFKLLNTWTHVK